MAETKITPVLPQVSTDPKGADIPCEPMENATDVQTMVDGEVARQTVQIEQEPEVVRKAPEPRIFSWSDYGMSKWMKGRMRKRSASRKTHIPRSAGRTFGEARSSTF
jgi:hypothetical protein